MKFPRTLDVLGFQLAVKFVPLADIENAMREQDDYNEDLNYYGYLEPHEYIAIGKELTRQEQVEVLVHEIGHEVQFVMSCLRVSCDIADEPIHTLYHRLLVGVLLTNKLLRIGL